MAYVSKEDKIKIVAAAKLVLARHTGWKVTFSVNHHSTMVATIQKAPKSIADDYINVAGFGSFYVNEYHIGRNWKGETLKFLQELLGALNTDNYDKSEPESDYFNVGHYTSIKFGRHDKPVELV